MTASSTAWPTATEPAASARQRPATQVVQVHAWDEFLAQHRAGWLALYERLGALPDLSPMWAEALVQGHQLPPSSVYVAVALDEDGRLLMVWPFQLKHVRKGPLSLPWIAPLQNAFCISAGALSALDEGTTVTLLLAALNGWRQPWHWIEIERLHAGSPHELAWQAACARGRLATRRHEQARAPYLAHQGTLEDYLAPRSKKFRKKVRGMVRDVADVAALQVVLYRTPDELAQFQPLALHIEERTWKHAEGSAISSRDWEQRFYAELMARLGPSGGFIAAVLFIAGQPVAHAIEWRHGARVLAFKSSYDQAYAKQSPGNLLMVALLQRYFDDGVQEYDFLGTNEAYKMEWTEQVRPFDSRRVYRRTLLSTLWQLAEHLKSRPAAAGDEVNPASADSA